MQGAADRQYGRNNATIEGFRRFLDSDVAGAEGRSMAGLSGMDGMGDFAERMARAGDPSGAVGEMRRAGKGMDQDIDEAMGTLRGARGQAGMAADQAQLGASQFAQDIAGMDSMVEQDAAAVASAIRREAQSQMQMARAGVHPDGTPMTGAERTDMMLRIQGDTSARVAQAVQPIFSQWHQLSAGLRSQLAQTRQQAAALRMQGAQTQAGIGEAMGNLGQSRAAIEMETANAMQRELELRRSYGELSTTIRQMKQSLQQAAVFKAVELETQGLLAYAELVRSNPETVVSRFQGMLAMYAAASAGSGSAYMV